MLYMAKIVASTYLVMRAKKSLKQCSTLCVQNTLSRFMVSTVCYVVMVNLVWLWA